MGYLLWKEWDYRPVGHLTPYLGKSASSGVRSP